MSSNLVPAAAAATAIAIAAYARKAQLDGDWETAIEKVSRGVVVVRVSSVKAFDMNDAGFSYATGFVVDLSLGLIMTNRHVVTTGPVTADAVLLNKEEVELLPVYADPVHDFGFFRYDPTQVRYMQLHQIPLAPSNIRVGLDVRVVGNDAGEKISILSGTIARLDRAAPHYGSSTYNDFNTFYYSCASNTSGGSSGSPVINSRGEAIALNAGTSTKSASSYYLPLDKPLRALKLLQAALKGDPKLYKGARKAVPRGEIGVILVHKAFGELRRFGLRDATEAAVRHRLKSETGMLVVEQVLPGGPASGKLQPGDILLSISKEEGAAGGVAAEEDGGSSSGGSTTGAWWQEYLTAAEMPPQVRPLIAVAQYLTSATGGGGEGGGEQQHAWCTTFRELEDVVDSSVKQQVSVIVQRGGLDLTLSLTVQDLHSLSPDVLLEVGGASLHMLSYQQARNHNLSPGAVSTAYSGYMLANAGVPSRAILLELNSIPTPTLEEFIKVLNTLPDRSRVPLRYAMPSSQHQERLVVITIDRTWFSCATCTRDDVSGKWISVDCEEPPPPSPPLPQAVTFAFSGPPEVQAVTPSLVRVLFDIPYQIDGVACLKYVGAGLVVDASIGLVLVDRNTVPVVPGDVRVEFASSVEIPAVVRFLHPTHNFGFVQYDPSALDEECEVTSATLSPDPIDVGEECLFVGLSKIDSSALPVFQPCVVRESCVMEIGLPSIPRYRAVNEEVIRFDLGMALEDTIGGVFVDSDGRVKAIWGAYATCSSHDEDLYEQFEGMPIGAAIPIVKALARAADIEEADPPPWQVSAPAASPSPAPTTTTANGGSQWHDAMETPTATPRKEKTTSNGPDANGFTTASNGTPIKMTSINGLTSTSNGHDFHELNYPQPTPVVHFLDAELKPISISTACGISEGSGLGLTRLWAERLSEADAEKRQALLVQRLSPRVRAGGPAIEGVAGRGKDDKGDGGLQEGDLLLALDDTPVATFTAVEQCTINKSSVQVTLLRDGMERTLIQPLDPVASDGTVHIIQWCGLVVQEAYRAVLERGFEPQEGGVYISYYLFGSPAHKHKLVPKHWIVELNGQPVTGMQGFVELIQTLRHGESCRVKTCDLTGRASAYTLKTDHNYWRAYEVKREKGEWVQRTFHEPEGEAEDEVKMV